MSGTVGKMMKKLYIKKYELAADFKAFTKRQTLFNGRPIHENTYYERDEDIIENAIREVMKKYTLRRVHSPTNKVSVNVKPKLTRWRYTKSYPLAHQGHFV